MALIKIGNQIVSPLVIGGTSSNTVTGGSVYIVGLYATAPTVATSGSRYYNTTNNKIFISNGTDWTDLEDLKTDTLYVDISNKQIYYVDSNKLSPVISGGDGLLYDKEYLYLTRDGEIITDGILITGSGALDSFELTSNLSATNFSIASETSFVLDYTYTSKYGQTATVEYLVNGVTCKSSVITDGTYRYDISSYLKAGANTITVKVTDTYATVKTLLYTVNVIQVTLSSTFDSSSTYATDISFRYTPIGNLSKNVYFELDGVVGTPDVVTVSGRLVTKMLTGLTHGVHRLKVWATATVEGVTVTSNTLFYEIMYVEANNETVLIASEFTGTDYTQGGLVSIPYSVYNPASIENTVTLSINGVSQGDVSVDRTRQVWNNYVQECGTVTYTLTCGTVSRTFTIQVTELSINVEPVAENLQLHLTSKNRSNAEANKSVWKYNDVTASMAGFNWVTDGWIQDKDLVPVLRVANNARVEIPFKPFSTDARLNGRTIEIEFAVRDILEATTVIASCMSGNRGFEITAQGATLKSEQSSVGIKFKEEERIRIGFVIDSLASDRLIRTYVNGIFSGMIQYPTDDDFSQTSPANILLGSSQATIDIYNIRVYDASLSIRDMLNNYIADTMSISQKFNLYNRNNIYNDYGDVLYNKVLEQLPCMIITGALPTYKGDKKKVNVDFQNSADTARNCSYTGVTIDIQGTSSQYFPRKNYKISKLPTAYQLRANSIPETTFTIKVDYMESSHCYNTGFTKFVNTLYLDKTPPQLTNSAVRTCIDGFPIALFYRPTATDPLQYFGVGNFNNDKGNNATYGFVAGCESWETVNNTSDRCLFKSDDFSDPAVAINDFEARYPSVPTYTNLQRLVSWVISCDKEKATGNAITPVTIGTTEYTTDTAEYRCAKFKNEYLNYFNQNFLLTYFILSEFFGMVDSRAKNLFLNTYDGNIWYPVYYDTDTMMGLNNEGVNNFPYNMEYHDTIGTLSIFNGESSALWNMVEATLMDEAKDLYNELRNNGSLSYENAMKYFYDEQIGQICEAQYNSDAEVKYMAPLLDDKITSYLYCAQGSRLYHIEWWLYNRFKYMDSKYVASDYSAQYLTMRLYTPSTWEEVAPNATFNITPAIDEYVTVQYGAYVVRARGNKGVASTITPPAITFNDTETIIYGADKISDIGDLSALYAGSIDVTKATKLTSLKIGAGGNYSNTNLARLSLGNNTLLTNIDVRNCPNLVGALDVSGCTALLSVDATGTALTSVKLPSAGSLTKMYLPSTITNLTIKNQLNLLDFNIGSYSNITTLCLENTCLDSKYIFDLCTNVTKVRITKANWTASDMSVLDRIYNMAGIDENGYTTTNGFVSGTLYLTTPTLISTIQKYSKKFVGLTITAVSYIAEDNIYADDGTPLIAGDGSYLVYSEIE